MATGALDNFSEYQILLWQNANALQSYGLGIRPGTMVFNSHGSYQFDEVGVTRVTFASGGNVGIGNTAPGYALTVTRTAPNTEAFLHLEGTGDVNAAGINIRDVDTDRLWHIVNRSADNNKLQFYRWNAGWQHVMTMDLNGGVGIGTTTPGAKLDVAGRVALSGLESPGYGGASAGVAILGTPNSGGGLLFRPAGLNSASGEVLFRSDASYFSGNVGIGTMTPGADVTMTGGLTINGTGWTQLTVQKNGTSGFAMNVGQFIAGDVNMYDMVGGTWNLAITLRGGNVGIGTGSPRTRFDVPTKNSNIVGNGTSQDGPTNAIIEAGNSPARYYDWPNGWGGGLSTWDIAGSASYLSTRLTRSDRAYKTNISPIEADPNFVQKFMQLNPVTYNFNRETIPANEWDYQRLHYGFIANEVEKLFPDIVVNAGLDPSIKRGLEYDAFIPMLVKIVQNQQKTIENLQQENTSLKSELQELKNELDHLKAYVGLKSQK